MNEDDEEEPRLAYCCMQEPDSLRAGPKHEPLTPLWCVRETLTVAPEHGRLDVALEKVHDGGVSGGSGNGVGLSNGHVTSDSKGEGSGGDECKDTTNIYNNTNTNTNTNNNNTTSKCYHYGQCHMNPYFEPSDLLLNAITPASAKLSQYAPSAHISHKADDKRSGTVYAPLAAPVTNSNQVSPRTSPRGSNKDNISSGTTTTNNTTVTTTTPTTNNTNNTTTSTPHTTFTYTLVDCEHHSEEVLSSWKGLFATTWEMKCALPEAGSLIDGVGISVPILSRANSANVKYVQRSSSGGVSVSTSVSNNVPVVSNSVSRVQNSTTCCIQ